MEKKIKSTYKSKDTEEFLDIWFTRPCGFVMALLCNALRMHPNVVTIISMVIGAFGGFCFYFGELKWSLIGVGSMIFANILDSADGQLARMSGKTSQLGRLLDGFSGDVWFFAMYLAIVLRLQTQYISLYPLPFEFGIKWGVWIWLAFFLSGAICHKNQVELSDYHRNIYLWFQSGSGELTDSSKVDGQVKAASFRTQFIWKLACIFYRSYTRRQEKQTPHFQTLFNMVKQRYGNDLPQALRDDFCTATKPILFWDNVITFNTRIIVMYISVLMGAEWIYLLFEICVMSLIWIIIRIKHENICKRIANGITQGKY
ncbi:MAG: CDP-alcohol phosphatidyltransferase family protein [Bacteroidaceae bacterium]|nr:CDP-alcohol phosphatidyltransferase family protein [Bacteroidaceae bacterium]